MALHRSSGGVRVNGLAPREAAGAHGGSGSREHGLASTLLQCSDMRDFDTAFDLSDVISYADLANWRAMTAPTIVVETAELDSVLTALTEEISTTASS
ncbi:MAG: hypothetical protein M3619_11535 [Myxococcota bacterium]|nr:hypothetical protein [Myxococcota bacterium]